MDVTCFRIVIFWLLIGTLLIRISVNQEIDLLRYNHKTVTTGVYQSIRARSLLHCSTLCMTDPNCNSGDFNVNTAECRFSIDVGPSLIASLAGDSNLVAFGKIDCGEPIEQPNSYLDVGNTTSGSQRQYSCNINYAPTVASDVRSMLVTCQSNGNWSAIGFECVIDCGVPNPIIGVSIEAGPTVLACELLLECESGYLPENDGITNTSIECQSTGSWSPVQASFNCLKECNAPPNVTNADITSPPAAVYKENDVTTYACSSGYGATPTSDAGITTCTASGVWSSTSLTCLEDCGEPPGKSNAGISSGGTLEGDTRTYSCNAGYGADTGSDDGTITCQSGAIWSTCTLSCVVDCGAPSTKAGVSVGPGITIVGSQLVLQCSAGYEPQDPGLSSVTIQCEADWTWSGYNPSYKQCLRDCGEPPSKSNTAITAGDTLEGATRTYSCLPSYSPATGSDSGGTTCQSNGAWSTSTLTCEKDCGEPASKANAGISAGDTLAGNTRTYSCQAGYSADAGSDSGDVTCQSNGAWTTSSLACVVDCGEPASKTNADISAGNNQKGDTRTYSCQSGYSPLDGSESGDITCRSNGAWTTSGLTCKRDCGAPPSKANADISTGTNLEGDTRTYSCQSGYAKVPGTGNGEITCRPNGSWSSSAYACQVDCGTPPSKNNAWVSSGGTSEGDTRTYACNANYGPKDGSDNGVVTCQSNSQWSTSTLRCGAAVTVAQWVASVPAYSSQWTKDDGWEASQVTGANNVYPSYGDLSGAWCSKDGEHNGYLDLQYNQAVYMTKVEVYETHHGGGVMKILYTDTSWNWHTVYQTSTLQNIHSARIFSPSFSMTGTKTKYVKLEIHCGHWIQIDAVKMTGITYG